MKEEAIARARVAAGRAAERGLIRLLDVRLARRCSRRSGSAIAIAFRPRRRGARRRRLPARGRRTLGLLLAIARTLGALPRERPDPPRRRRRPAASGRPARASCAKLEREVGLVDRDRIRRPLPVAPDRAQRRRRPPPRCAGVDLDAPTRLRRGAARAGGLGARPRPTGRGRATTTRPGCRSTGSPYVVDARRSAVKVAEVAERSAGAPRRGRARGRRQARGARARAARPARRRPRPDRGLPRPREDADRALVRAGDRASASAGSSSRPT